jgi:thiosulfate dehydrogenase (quinone) large subunit
MTSVPACDIDVTCAVGDGQRFHRIVTQSGQVPSTDTPARSWALVPLRLFLGVTFTFAGLQKLANPSYLDGSSPLSVQATIHALQHQSPIGFLLAASGHAPKLVGVLIAVGELAVGLATVLGLWVRLAAIGGFLLATTFFLTVSWRTRPYYYGSDIVFMAVWTVPLIRGSWDGPTLDAWIRRRAARDADPHRRTLVLGGVAAGALAVFSGTLAAVVAVVGRALNDSPAPATLSPAPSTSPSGRATSSRSATAAAPGREIAKAGALAPGAAVGFHDNSGTPAWLVHETSGDFRAFRAVCTHAGCTVQYNANLGFVCPCHGGEFDADTGAVIAGPPPAPLARLPITVVGGSVRLL